MCIYIYIYTYIHPQGWRHSCPSFARNSPEFSRNAP